MSDDYRQLLDATILHLEGLKSRGARHVAVAPETLRALAMPARLMPTPAVAQKPFSPPPAVTRPAPATTAVVTAPPVSSIVQPPSSPEKSAAFATLRERALACVKCPNLASSRKNVVFGVGNIDSPLMFVGEAPGADEDEQGEPFVGKAGQLLTKIIQATGLSVPTFTLRTF